MITYLFACSKPSITFIISSCLVTTRDECESRLAAGCFSFSTPSGSSGILTGVKRLLSSTLVSRNELDTASIEDCFPSADWAACEELLCNSGILRGGGGRRVSVFRGPRGVRGLEVAKAARITATGDRKNRVWRSKGGITLSKRTNVAGEGRVHFFTSVVRVGPGDPQIRSQQRFRAMIFKQASLPEHKRMDEDVMSGSLLRAYLSNGFRCPR